MTMRLLTFPFWILPLAGFILTGLVGQATAAPAEKVLATVNEVAITQQDLEIEQAQIIAEMRLRNRPMGEDQIAPLKKALVENLIDRELLYQRAQEKKLQIRKRWVERSLGELKEKIGSSENYQAYLKLAKMDETQLKERLRKGLIVQRLLRRDVVNQIKVSEAEMQAFFRQHPEFFIRKEQVRIRHILIAVKNDQDGELRGQALLRIQALQNMLYEETNFAALALEHSDGPSKYKGGDLGYLERGQMIKAFADAAFALQPEEVSDIVETHLGYHLIQMVDRIPASQMAYRHARDKIERTLRRNKEKKAADAYLARLKKRAAVRRLVTFKKITR